MYICIRSKFQVWRIFYIVRFLSIKFDFYNRLFDSWNRFLLSEYRQWLCYKWLLETFNTWGILNIKLLFTRLNIVLVCGRRELLVKKVVSLCFLALDCCRSRWSKYQRVRLIVLQPFILFLRCLLFICY